MLINYVPSAHGSLDLGPVQLDNGHGYAGSEPLSTEFLLFEFVNDTGGGDTVGVQVSCTDSQISTSSDPTVLWWDAGERGTKCVEFSDFAPQNNDQAVWRCEYQVTYLNLGTGTNPSPISMSIYIG